MDILDELGITTDPRIAYKAHKDAQQAKRAKPKTEYEEQKRLMKWARENVKIMPELTWLFHVPNGGAYAHQDGYSVTGNKMKASGVKSGVPDLCLPIRRLPYSMLWIEMKRTKGGRVREAQSAWIEHLKHEGCKVEVCKGWQEARDIIKAYLTPNNL